MISLKRETVLQYIDKCDAVAIWGIGLSVKNHPNRLKFIVL